MSINEILKDINKKMDYLFRVNVKLSGNKLDLNYYDIINMYYVNLTMSDENSNYDIIIHPTRQITLIYYIIAAALTAYEIDLTDISSELIKNLEIGDKVIIDNCRGEYLGKEKILDKLTLKVKFENNLVYYLPIDYIWKLRKYEGKATSLNNYSKKKRKVTNKGRNVLGDIFNIDMKEHNIVQKTKVIVVTQKRFATSTFNNLYINGAPVTRLFPTGYYSSKDKLERIGKDPFQQHPVICFTSDLSVVNDILDKDTRLVLFDASNYVNIPTVQLEQITNNKYTNILTLMNKREDDFYVYDKIGMNLYKWDKKTLNDIFLMDKTLTDDVNTKEINSHQSLLYNFTYHHDDIYIIETQEKFKLLRERILSSVKKVRDNSNETPFTLQYMNKVFYILLYTQIVLCPISFERNLNDLKTLNNTISEIENLISDTLSGMYEQNKENWELLDKIPSLLRKYVDYFLNYNKKGEKLIEILHNLNDDTVVVVRRKREKYVLKKWLNSKNYKYIDVLKYNELKQGEIYTNIIFPGWYKELKGYPLKHELAENHIFIIYDFEEKYLGNLKYMENQHSRIPSILNKFDNSKIDKIKHYTKEVGAAIEDEDDISEFLSDLSLRYANIAYTTGRKDNESSELEEAYYISFIEEYYTFITEGCKVHVLSRNDEKVVKKSIKELNVGDELVFSIHNKGDIFEELISKIEKENPEIKRIKETADLWQDALNRYINNGSDISAFLKKLEKYGYKRVEATVENWLNNYDQIAPGEYGIIKAIGEITGDKKLQKNLQDVIVSCRRLKTIHVQLGRYIARTIINSVFSDEDNHNDFFDFTSVNPDDYAMVVTIDRIINEKSLVPSHRVNKLIEKY